MARFLICCFCFILLYPIGIDMYLVGLPRIALSLNASEAQLHIAFSVYLAGMAGAMIIAGPLADRCGRRPVVLCGAVIFILASLMCSQAQHSPLFLAGRVLQGIGAGCCYVVAFAIMRDVLDHQRRAKVLSLLNGITCIVPVLAPVLGHLIMLRFPWQSLFYVMGALGVVVGFLALRVLKETLNTGRQATISGPDRASETLLNRLFISRLLISTLSVGVILTYVNISPVLMMENLHFSRGEYASAMALLAVVSMIVSFSTPFLLEVVRQRTLMIAAQLLFSGAAVALSLAHTPPATLAGLALISAGFSLGFGLAMSQALGPFSRRAGLASSLLGVSQVCGASLYIWLAAILGISALNMLIGMLIGCSIISLLLIAMVRTQTGYEKVDHHARS